MADEYEKPTYIGAVKDRIKGLLPGSGRGALGKGEAGRAADKITSKQKRDNDAVTAAERGFKNGGSVKKGKKGSGVVRPNGKYC